MRNRDGLAARLLPSEEQARAAPRGECCLRSVHLVVFAVSVAVSALAWGASAAVLCYHFAWSACFSWIFAWLVGAHDATQRAGFLISASDDEVACLLRSARSHGPRAHAHSPPPTATVYVTVFTESFAQVLRPTIEQAVRVVRKYNTVCMRGDGALGPSAVPPANLLVLDDGLQIVSDEERDERIGFYHSHGISYIARPPQGAQGFVREGFFKKAGNLNHAHALARVAMASSAARRAGRGMGGGSAAPECSAEAEEQEREARAAALHARALVHGREEARLDVRANRMAGAAAGPGRGQVGGGRGAVEGRAAKEDAGLQEATLVSSSSSASSSSSSHTEPFAALHPPASDAATTRASAPCCVPAGTAESVDGSCGHVCLPTSEPCEGALCCLPTAPWCSLRASDLPADSSAHATVLNGGSPPVGAAEGSKAQRRWDAPPTAPQLRCARVHGDIRIGEFVLLLDNDSFAPDEALIDSVAVLAAEPGAGFLQHVSAPLGCAASPPSGAGGEGAEGAGESLSTALHSVSSLVFWGVTMRSRAWAAPAPLLGHNVALRTAALEAAGGYHTGRGADDLSTGVAMRLHDGGYGLLAKLYPWEAGFKEGLPRSYRQLAAQWRRYGAVANGTVTNPLPDWERQGALQPQLASLLFLAAADRSRGTHNGDAAGANGRSGAGEDEEEGRRMAAANNAHPPPRCRAAAAVRAERAARVGLGDRLDLLQFWLPGAQGLAFFGLFLPVVLASLLRGCAGPEGGGLGWAARWPAPQQAGAQGAAWQAAGESVAAALAAAAAGAAGAEDGGASADGLGAGVGSSGVGSSGVGSSGGINGLGSSPAGGARAWHFGAAAVARLHATPHLGLPIGLACSLLLPALASAVLRLQRDAPRLPARLHLLHALLGAPLHVSLWFAFTLGFALDHSLKTIRAYKATSTHAEARLAVCAHLRAHRMQLAYGFGCVLCAAVALARAPAGYGPTACAALLLGCNLASAPFLLDPPALRGARSGKGGASASARGPRKEAGATGRGRRGDGAPSLGTRLARACAAWHCVAQRTCRALLPRRLRTWPFGVPAAGAATWAHPATRSSKCAPDAECGLALTAATAPTGARADAGVGAHPGGQPSAYPPPPEPSAAAVASRARPTTRAAGVGPASSCALSRAHAALFARSGSRLAALDGLRALACLWVLSYHALGYWFCRGWDAQWQAYAWHGAFSEWGAHKPPAYLQLLGAPSALSEGPLSARAASAAALEAAVSSGSLGVDAFLALSGFLIGSMLLRPPPAPNSPAHNSAAHGCATPAALAAPTPAHAAAGAARELAEGERAPPAAGSDCAHLLSAAEWQQAPAPAPPAPEHSPLRSVGWALAFLARRALRLLPMHLLAMAVSLCWRGQREACSRYWVSHLLFVSNLRTGGMADGCVGQAWSVSLEFQLYACSIPFIAWAAREGDGHAESTRCKNGGSERGSCGDAAAAQLRVRAAEQQLRRAAFAGGACLLCVLACRAAAPLLAPMSLDGALVAPPDLILTQLPTRAAAYVVGLLCAFAHAHELAVAATAAACAHCGGGAACAQCGGRAAFGERQAEGAALRLTAGRLRPLLVSLVALTLIALGPADAAGAIHRWNREWPAAHAAMLVLARPLFGACVGYGMLHVLHRRTALSRLLEARAWVPVAAVSYAAYMLQHAPLNIASQLATRHPTFLALRGVEGAPQAAAAFIAFSLLLITATLALAALAHVAIERPALAWIRAVAEATGREVARADSERAAPGRAGALLG